MYIKLRTDVENKNLLIENSYSPHMGYDVATRRIYWQNKTEIAKCEKERLYNMGNRQQWAIF